MVDPSDVFALVPAAGEGCRYGGRIPKQLESVGGRTLLEWSLLRLREAGVGPFVVAVPAAHREPLTERLAGADVTVITGGATRQESVDLCLGSSGAGPEDLVLVHDAARAAVDPSDVRAVIRVAAKGDGAILGRPVADTIKRVEGRRLLGTVDRTALFRAETPQVFRRRVLEEALVRAARDGFVGTDEASLVERVPSVTVDAVTAASPNPKVTWPGDLEVTAALLAGTAE